MNDQDMTGMAPEKSADLIPLPAGTDLGSVYSEEGGVERVLSLIEQEVRSHAVDASTERGRDEIRSRAYKVARSKTLLDDAGKKQTEEARAKIAAVNEKRKVVATRLDALKEEHRKPLTEWENAEKTRIAAHEESLKALEPGQQPDGDAGLAALRAARNALAAVETGPAWEEYEDAAARLRAESLDLLGTRIAAAEKREAEAAELERLRRAEEERQAKEAEERVARAAEEALADRARDLRADIRSYAKGPDSPEKLSPDGLVRAWSTAHSWLVKTEIGPDYGRFAEDLRETLGDAVERAADKLAIAEAALEKHRRGERAAAEERARAEAQEEAARDAERRAEEEKRLDDLTERLIAHVFEVGHGRIGGEAQAYGILFHELESKVPTDFPEIGPDRAARVQRVIDETLARLRAAQEEQRQRLEREEAEAAQAAAEAAEREAKERRAADAKHRRAVIAETAQAIEGVLLDNEDADREGQARAVAEAILAGSIPNAKGEF